MCFGLPLRTPITTTERVTIPPRSPAFQSCLIKPGFAHLLDVGLERERGHVGFEAGRDRARLRAAAEIRLAELDLLAAVLLCPQLRERGQDRLAVGLARRGVRAERERHRACRCFARLGPARRSERVAALQRWLCRRRRTLRARARARPGASAGRRRRARRARRSVGSSAYSGATKHTARQRISREFGASCRTDCYDKRRKFRRYITENPCLGPGSGLRASAQPAPPARISPRWTVTAWPPSSTRSPRRRCARLPPRADAW